jgi:hypothetical protein
MTVRIAFSKLELLQEAEDYVDSHLDALEREEIGSFEALGLLTDFVNTVSAKKFSIDRLDVSDV